MMPCIWEEDLITKETGVCNGKGKRSRDEDDALMEEETRDENRKIPMDEAVVNKSSANHNSSDTGCDNGCADTMLDACESDNTCIHNIPSDEHFGEGSRIGNAKAVALARMKLNMEENGFEYLPPRIRRRSTDYLHYRRKKMGGKLHYVAHADYYILLRACAKLAQVDVRIMHLGVLKLERRLGWLEQRICDCLMLFRHELERIPEENETAHL